MRSGTGGSAPRGRAWPRPTWSGRSTARVAELVSLHGEPMPGALDAVQLCGRLALPAAVCSGSYAVVIQAALDRLGIGPAITAWHSAEWEPLGKPHPAAYLSTAAKLGVDPTRCLAVEDSFNGAVAAKAARMRVVAVPEPERLRLTPLGPVRRRAPQLLGLDEALLRRLER